MTMAKQDPEAWRKRVDRNLKQLATSHQELKVRMDTYEIKLQTSTDMINKKLDHLLKHADDFDKMLARIGLLRRIGHGLARAFKWFLEGSSKLTLGLLGVLTLAWVTEHSSTWSEWWENFIKTFNGTTR